MFYGSKTKFPVSTVDQKRRVAELSGDLLSLRSKREGSAQVLTQEITHLPSGPDIPKARPRRWIVWYNFSTTADPERSRYMVSWRGDASLSSVSDSGAAMRREVHLLG